MFACNIVTGLLSSHKMFAQKQLVGLMFMCVCLSLITHAYPCGTNPLQVVQKIADAKGVTYKQLLSNLEFRRQVNYLYKKYARCVGIVETGTYKRSMEPQLLQSSESSMMDPSNYQDHGDIYRRSDSFYKRASLLKRQDTNNPGQPFYFYK
ncbi:Hypothetical predicted protein [Octopus vulgaris]|uniref:Uncharacterized protein n=2 Tax=Octopus TaxID=6643 RepID=A0AA36BX47_OCTVU|nr:Hypothetical predicted protein [Octopus vulgaris]